MLLIFKDLFNYFLSKYITLQRESPLNFLNYRITVFPITVPQSLMTNLPQKLLYKTPTKIHCKKYIYF